MTENIKIQSENLFSFLHLRIDQLELDFHTLFAPIRRNCLVCIILTACLIKCFTSCICRTKPWLQNAFFSLHRARVSRHMIDVHLAPVLVPHRVRVLLVLVVTVASKQIQKSKLKIKPWGANMSQKWMEIYWSTGASRAALVHVFVRSFRLLLHLPPVEVGCNAREFAA